MLTLHQTKKKGQVSFELIVLIMAAFIATLVFFVAMEDRIISIYDQTEQSSLFQITQLLHDEIVLASSVHDGYGRTFSLPLTAQGQNYSIMIEDDRVIRTWIQDIEASTVTFNVTGQPVLGKNTIRKENGEIILN